MRSRPTPGGRIFAVFAAAGLLLGCAAAAPPVLPGPGLPHYLEQPSPYRLVEVLSGESDRERQRILMAALDAADISYAVEPFGTGESRGENLIAELGDGKAVMVIVAHYDRVPQSPGANDNAACVAAALRAYRLLAADGGIKNTTVRFLFSDDEEIGLLGSKAHVAANDVSSIEGVVSLELCGIGDAIGIWDVHGPAEGSLIVDLLSKAAAREGVYHGIHGEVPRFASDHVNFAREGLPAVGLTVLPREDEQTLRDYVANPNGLRWLFRGNRPTIFQTYHTPEDSAATIDPAALEMTARIVARAVRLFDRAIAARAPIS